MTFRRALLLLMLLGFGVRVAYVAIAKGESCHIRVDGREIGSSPSECALGDQVFYNREANALAHGDGERQLQRRLDAAGLGDHLAALTRPTKGAWPAADHPPLTVFALAPASWIAEHTPLGGDALDTNVREQRYEMVLLGTVVVGLVGLLGRRVGGDTVGLVAAGIAAVSPNIWVNDGLVMSETLTSLLVVSVLLAAVSWRNAPTPNRVAVVGALCGLAALARVEMFLLLPLVAVPLAWHRPERAKRVVTAIGATALVLAPWVIFNLARYDAPTFLSTNDGIALAGSNCDPVYHGPATGLTTYDPAFHCLDDPPPPGDESEVAKVYRKRAFDYMRAHKGRAIVVALARVGRTWSLFRPGDMITFNRGEGREAWVTRLGLVAYYPTLVGAIAGAVLLFRQRERFTLWVLCAPAIGVTIGSALTYGQTRFRAAAEPSLALLAAVAIGAAWTRVRRPAS